MSFSYQFALVKSIITNLPQLDHFTRRQSLPHSVVLETEGLVVTTWKDSGEVPFPSL